MNNIYSNEFRTIEILTDIPEGSTISLIYFSELLQQNDKKIFKFINDSPWKNIFDVYGFFINDINLFESRIEILESYQKFNINNGVIQLPTFLSKINGEICLHYNYNDNFTWRCYPKNFIKSVEDTCNICFEYYNSKNLNKCKRQKCKFLICNDCKFKLTNRFNKHNCPNCQIDLL